MRCKGVNVPQQCVLLLPLSSTRIEPLLHFGKQGPSLRMENHDPFLYHPSVSVCVDSPVFQYAWVILLWKNTCESCFICCRERFLQGDRERTFPALKSVTLQPNVFFFCRDPKSPILNALILYHKEKFKGFERYNLNVLKKHFSKHIEQHCHHLVPL